DIEQKISLFSGAAHLIYLSSVKIPALENCSTLKTTTLVPVKSYIEKAGTFVNYNGLAQKFKKVTTVVSEALTGTEIAQIFAGENLKIETGNHTANEVLTAVSNTRKDQVTMDRLKKNEFVFSRGRL
ncbi:MAG: NADH dehydrogenase subunit, partial [Bdellovibrionota bacterium]